ARYGRWLLATAVAVALGALLVRKVRWQDFRAALALASPWPVLAATVVAGSVCMGGCIERLYLLVRPLPHSRSAIGFLELTPLHSASSAAHTLPPAPAGEVLRTVQLTRRHGYSIGALVGVQLVEKVIEALGLSLEIAVVSFLAPLPRALGLTLTL